MIKVTDKYLLSEVLFVCVDDSIKRGDLNDKLKKLNAELIHLGMKEILGM